MTPPVLGAYSAHPRVYRSWSAHLILAEEHRSIALVLTQHLGHDHRADPARAVGDVILVAVIEDCLVLPIVEQDIQAMRPPRGGEGCTTLLGHEGKTS